MAELTKEVVKQLLEQGECIVEFEKVNGDRRRMFCTKKGKDIAEDTDSELCTVWSIDDDGYRSFYYVKVKAIWPPLQQASLF